MLGSINKQYSTLNLYNDLLSFYILCLFQYLEKYFTSRENIVLCNYNQV